MTSICIEIIYTIKSRRFRFLNVIYITLTKIEMITILSTNIKIFLGKGITTNALLKNKIYAMQSGDLSYQDKKTTRYTDMYQIRCNLLKPSKKKKRSFSSLE